MSILIRLIILISLLLYLFLRRKKFSHLGVLVISTIAILCLIEFYFYFFLAEFTIYVRPVIILLAVGFLAASFIKINEGHFFPKNKILKFITILIGLILCLDIFVAALDYLKNPAMEEVKNTKIQISSPLKGDKYIISSGGNSPKTNGHHFFMAQRFAYDINKINSLGSINANLFESDELNDFEIFGDEVFSPCSGTVIDLRNDLKDNIPPSNDKVNLAGNFVSIYCKNTTIILAHLKYSSITVKLNQTIKDQALIGRVGNSGHSLRPHLHIHGVLGRVTDRKAILTDATPVMLLINGNTPERNDFLD